MLLHYGAILPTFVLTVLIEYYDKVSSCAKFKQIVCQPPLAKNEQLCATCYRIYVQTWKQRAISNCKLDFNVKSIGWSTVDKRWPEPIVDIVVRNITDHITAPIYSFAEIRKRFFHPLSTARVVRIPFVLSVYVCSTIHELFILHVSAAFNVVVGE